MLAIVFIVLGAVGYVGQSILNASLQRNAFSGLTTTLDRAQVELAHDQLRTASATFASSTRSCQGQTDPVPCLDQAASALASAFQAYGDSLAQIGFPNSAASEGAAAVAAARSATSQIQDLAQSPDLATYSSTAGSAAFSGSLQTVDTTYAELVDALSN